MYNEILFNAYYKIGNLEKAKELSFTLIDRNAENMNYYFSFLQANGYHYKDFTDLTNITDEKVAKEILTLLQSLKVKVKSKLLTRLEIAISKNEDFRDHFSLHLITNTRNCIPSIFFSIKFIYKLQSYKIQIINEVLNEYLAKIQNKETIIHPITKDTLDLSFLPHMDLIHYYAAQHFDFLRDLEKAMAYINLAIDQTPTFVEFYMIKSKILKHGFMLCESAIAYDKVTHL